MQVDVENRLEQCPKSCDYALVEAHTDQFFANNGLFRLKVVVACEYELVCKFRSKQNGLD